MLFGEADVVESVQFDKKSTMNRVIDNLKKELRRSHKCDPDHDPEDDLLSKSFMLKLHALLYKYKRYAQEMIAEANWR